MPSIVHEAASRKGGRIKTKKGLAAMDDDKKREIQSMGGKAKYENKSKETIKQVENNRNIADLSMDELHRALDE